VQACTCPSPAFWIMHRYEIILYGCMRIHSFCMGCCILQYYPRAALPHSHIAPVVTPTPHPYNHPCSPCNVLNPTRPSCPYPSAQEEANNLSSHYDRQISLQACIFGNFTHAHTRNIRIARLFIYKLHTSSPRWHCLSNKILAPVRLTLYLMQNRLLFPDND